MAHDEYADDEPGWGEHRGPRGNRRGDGYWGGYGEDVGEDPGAQRRWSAGGGFSGHVDGYGRGGRGPGEYGFGGGMARGPNTEWGGGYAGGYGRKGDYGRRGGFGELQRGGTGGDSDSRGDEIQGSSYARQSFAGRGPRSYRRSDVRINEEINEALTRHPDIDATDVEVRVENGVITLTGAVDDKYAKRLAEDIAEECSGVGEVRNELRVGRDGAGTGGEAGAGRRAGGT